MGSMPPLSLGPPVVRPLRMTVVRPLGKRTTTVLPQAGAVASSSTMSAAQSFLMGVQFSLLAGSFGKSRRASYHAGGASQRPRACATLGAKAKRRGDNFGTRDVRQAGLPVLPAGARPLPLKGRRVDGVRRAERPRAPRRDVRLLGRRPDRALHRRGRPLRPVRLRQPAARLNGARLARPCAGKKFLA